MEAYPTVFDLGYGLTVWVVWGFLLAFAILISEVLPFFVFNWHESYFKDIASDVTTRGYGPDLQQRHRTVEKMKYHLNGMCENQRSYNAERFLIHNKTYLNLVKKH
jgi:hypothetical protein